MTWFTHHPRQVRGSRQWDQDGDCAGGPWGAHRGLALPPSCASSFPGSPGMGGDTQTLCLDKEVALRGPSQTPLLRCPRDSMDRERPGPRGRGGRGQEGCGEGVRPELESMGAGLEETHRVSEESGKGQAGPGWCWPARALAANLLPPGSTPGGPPGSKDVDRSGSVPARPRHKLWSGAGRRERGAAHTYASVTALSDPVGVPGVTMSALSTSAHQTGQARPSLPTRALPQAHPTASGRRRQRPGPAPRLGNLRRNGFPEPQCKQSLCSVPHHAAAEAFEPAPNLPCAKTAEPGTSATWHPVPSPLGRPPFSGKALLLGVGRG